MRYCTAEIDRSRTTPLVYTGTPETTSVKRTFLPNNPFNGKLQNVNLQQLPYGSETLNGFSTFTTQMNDFYIVDVYLFFSIHYTRVVVLSRNDFRRNNVCAYDYHSFNQPPPPGTQCVCRVHYETTC
jgi:hypothetical protein